MFIPLRSYELGSAIVRFDFHSQISPDDVGHFLQLDFAREVKFAPNNTPLEVVKKLNVEIVAILKTETVRKRPV